MRGRGGATEDLQLPALLHVNGAMMTISYGKISMQADVGLIHPSASFVQSLKPEFRFRVRDRYRVRVCQ